MRRQARFKAIDVSSAPQRPRARQGARGHERGGVRARVRGSRGGGRDRSLRRGGGGGRHGHGRGGQRHRACFRTPTNRSWTPSPERGCRLGSLRCLYAEMALRPRMIRLPMTQPGMPNTVAMTPGGLLPSSEQSPYAPASTALPEPCRSGPPAPGSPKAAPRAATGPRTWSRFGTPQDDGRMRRSSEAPPSAEGRTGRPAVGPQQLLAARLEVLDGVLDGNEDPPAAEASHKGE